MAEDLLAGGLKKPGGDNVLRTPSEELLDMYRANAAEMATYDDMICSKIQSLGVVTDDVEVVVGIPYYTEISNIVSVVLALRLALLQRGTKAVIVVLGEFSRSDMVERLHEAGIHDNAGPESKVQVVSFWKPAPRYQQKPWSVRAFMVYASMFPAPGPNIMIVDADIQFNYWEISARSLCDALLGPLEADDNAAGVVCLNAPRSFYTDDGIVHLWCYLFGAAVYGMRIHQLHGGEFSLHRGLVRDIVKDQSILLDNAYCLQGQLMARAALAPQYGMIVEREMRGKWHAKITLGKLLLPDQAGTSRMDMVTERMFQDSLLLDTRGNIPPMVEHHSVTTPPHPGDVKMSVLAPGPSRREILRALAVLYRMYTVSYPTPHLDRCAVMASVVLPLAARLTARVEGSEYIEVSTAPKAGDEVFTPKDWAYATFELLHLYEEAVSDAERAEAIHGNRLVWLLGALAFLRGVADEDWAGMHRVLQADYEPVFRDAYREIYKDVAV